MDFTSLKFPRAATESEIEARKRQTLVAFQTEREKCPSGERRLGPQAGQKETSADLPEELIRYLQMIRDLPGIPATDRDKRYGIPLKKGSQMRKRLLDAGLIEELHVNPGIHGRNFKDLRLTDRGKEVLGTWEKREKTEEKRG